MPIDERAPRKVLLRGGAVYSPADPFATAMVVEGTTIAWIGSEDAADGFTDAVDELVDLRGALVTPAFTDAHVHTTATGLTLTGLNLADARDLADALDRITAYAAAHPGHHVLFGHGWDDTHWPENRPPSRAQLDTAADGRPLYLTRADMHSAAVSTALLQLVPTATAVEKLPGYHPDAPLTRDAHHAARHAAHAALTPKQRSDAQRATLRHAASLGIASLHECAGPDTSGEDDLTGLLRLAGAEPGPRVVGYWGEAATCAGDEVIERIRDLGAIGAAGDLFADGSLGSHTACLHQPYADAPHNGVSYLTERQIADHITACTEAGLQAGFHAIGDAAVSAVINGARAAAERLGADRVRAARHRIEHAEMLTPAIVAALADLGFIASVQPAFDAVWGGDDGMYAHRLGRERARTLNPYAALLKAGVPLALGSDSPATPLDPWGTVRAAAFHRTLEHRISVRAAFTAHTRGGRRAARDDAGVLVPGAPADYAVFSCGDLVVQIPDERVVNWSTDPRSGTPGLPDLTPGSELPGCLRTVVGGRTVYDQLNE
jgi:predicted amidohydrolase YtcJ